MADEVYIDSKAPSAETQWLLMNEKVKNAQNQATSEVIHLREIMTLEDKHSREMVEMVRLLNDKAIDKALESMLEKQESSNGKFALLKEQGIQAELRFAHKSDLVSMEEKNQLRSDSLQKQIAVLARIAAIGLGILLTLQFAFSIGLAIWLKT